jgi:hypothetical protein
MSIVPVAPAMVVAVASFPVVTVSPVVAVVAVSFPSIVNAESAATQICTNYVVEVLSFWADPLLKHCSLYTTATYLVMVYTLHPGVFENS